MIMPVLCYAVNCMNRNAVAFRRTTNRIETLPISCCIMHMLSYNMHILF